MSFATSIAFLLISAIVFVVVIEIGSLIYRAVVLNQRVYDGREYFDDYMRIENDNLIYDPIEIEVIDRWEAYNEQS